MAPTMEARSRQQARPTSAVAVEPAPSLHVRLHERCALPACDTHVERQCSSKEHRAFLGIETLSGKRST